MIIIWRPLGGGTATTTLSVPATVRTTVRDLLTRALSDIEQVQAGEDPTPEDLQLAFDRANDFLDSLMTEPLGSAYTIERKTWTLTTAVSITIGSGGVIDIPRPVNPQAIQNVGYIDTAADPDFEYAFGSPLTIDAYIALPQKAMRAPTPQSFYYNPTYPLGTLIPWPIPTASNLLGVLYAPTPVSVFSALTDEVVLPPGYLRYLRTQIAIELAPAFGVKASDDLRRTAIKAEANVKRANMRPTDMLTDWSGHSRYDINSDGGYSGPR